MTTTVWFFALWIYANGALGPYVMVSDVGPYPTLEVCTEARSVVTDMNGPSRPGSSYANTDACRCKPRRDCEMLGLRLPDDTIESGP